MRTFLTLAAVSAFLCLPAVAWLAWAYVEHGHGLHPVLAIVLASVGASLATACAAMAADHP